LLVVIALIAGLAAMLFSEIGAGSKTSALDTAQTAMAGMVTVARTNAISSGRAVRLMFNIDATSFANPSRYLRYVVLQTQVSPTEWQTVADLYLPTGVYFVPGDFSSLPAGLFAEGAPAWVRADASGNLRSTVLRSGQLTTEQINSTVAEQWCALSFSSIGTTAQAGDLVLGLGRSRAPGAYVEGESPIELYQRDNVSGITLSSYGLAVLIGDRSGF
jgi:hypothetical protein